MSGAFTNFNGIGVGAGAIATFGGQAMPYCNYTSPLARKFIYKEQNKVFSPLRRHIFRMKVRTAADIRINEVVKKFMSDKLRGAYGFHGATMTNNIELDHCSWVIPKDAYEVKKLTSYMTSKKMSQDYKDHMQNLWTRVLFTAEAHNYPGMCENLSHQFTKAATDEEFMAWMWYVIIASTAIAFVVTMVMWWRKYDHTPQYIEVR